ncbi:uncharacterized protein LOC123692122 isoform X1 [Colias croceus]|uniref:uncharacterized protein LOC123692122 isoform X1 n=1 Tax=Colias crocea TaxID=72248 RepID=UPI001E27E919|nr:uncharacterized protein LOC123692122 isoform X1 [Colias croceus]
MKGLITISAILLQLSWCYGYPDPRGVGAYAYQDTAGNRYGGTYGLDDKGVTTDPYNGPLLTNFADNYFPNYIIPNYDNIIQEVIANLEAHRLASYAPFNAFDMTANHIGEFPNFSRFPQFGPQNFFGPSGMPFDMSQNSAFASGVAGPGFTQQIAAINPESDLMKNVAITNRFNDDSNPNKFYSVSSSSYSSSSNLGGQAQSNRGAETVVNNNGKITKYRVQS